MVLSNATLASRLIHEADHVNWVEKGQGFLARFLKRWSKMLFSRIYGAKSNNWKMTSFPWNLIVNANLITLINYMNRQDLKYNWFKLISVFSTNQFTLNITSLNIPTLHLFYINVSLQNFHMHIMNDLCSDTTTSTLHY